MSIKLTEADKIRIQDSNDIFAIMQRILLRENKIDRDREHFWVLGLAANNRLLFVELISKGSVNATLVEPMEVYSFALQKRAVRIIICHNHPSGNLIPSEEDKYLTDRLIQTGIIVNVELIDHLIITENSFSSFENSGLMKHLRENSEWVLTKRRNRED